MHTSMAQQSSSIEPCITANELEQVSKFTVDHVVSWIVQFRQRLSINTQIRRRETSYGLFHVDLSRAMHSLRGSASSTSQKINVGQKITWTSPRAQQPMSYKSKQCVNIQVQIQRVQRKPVHTRSTSPTSVIRVGVKQVALRRGLSSEDRSRI